MKTGKFIVFEGIDGSGKSTQIALLNQWLSEQGRQVYVTREPSDGPIGVMIRQSLGKRVAFDEKTMAALFAADRLDHIHNNTNGLLAKKALGMDILSDRYYLSNYAYQSVGVELDWVKKLNEEAAKDMKPDLHIFIDLPVEVAISRIYNNRGDVELYETVERLTHTRNMFLKIIEDLRNEETIVVIDGSGTAEETQEKIRNAVEKILAES